MKRSHYLTNAELNDAHRECQKLGHLTNRMAGYLHQIADKYSHHPWFVGYSFREEMVSAAMLVLVESWHKFDPDKMHGDPEKPRKSNAFAYYTTCCYRVFLKYMKDEKTQADIKNALLIDMGYDPAYSYDGTTKTKRETPNARD